eukprot:gene6798-9312_t
MADLHHKSSQFTSDFISEALFDSKIRLDGRGPYDSREVIIGLSRSETRSSSEIRIGTTFVVCIVTGEITSPYPDRPVEGILVFEAEVPPTLSRRGSSHPDITHGQICRLLEKSIRESEAIDLESLCIVAGEKVWSICCELKVLDMSGGNVIDACMLAAIAALRAFRKPEVSVISVTGDDVRQINKNIGEIIIHHSNDREPLPLALQHSPLCVTVGVIQRTSARLQLEYHNKQDSNTNNTDFTSKNDSTSNLILFLDPSVDEEAAMNGKLIFSINAHRELCGLNKPGGIALSSELIIEGSNIANIRAQSLHLQLNKSLEELEKEIIQERELQLEKLRKYRSQTNVSNKNNHNDNRKSSNEIEMDISSSTVRNDIAGIDRNDPILQWSMLHRAVISSSGNE